MTESLGPEDYERVRELYAELHERSRHEQRAALERLDLSAAVRSELVAFLDFDETEVDFEDSRLGELGHALAAERLGVQVVEETVPTHIGAYRVLRKLGEGGMGIVYAAQREGSEVIAAVKVIRSTLGSAHLSKRFTREARVLDRLRHPGIAAFYDSGEASVDTGSQRVSLPFLAMEYVDGMPLLKYAAEHELDDRARVLLVARICDAIHHAHEQGIVHRDLKPGNVLVLRSGDEAGQPKVLDFGVARVEVDVNTMTETNTGALLGTLPYMSPEQARGERCTPLSDVYSIGVLLYELLTGRLPYRIKNRPIAEALRAIQEEEPTRLGSVYGRLGGDLEVIVAHALEKEPKRRYATAADFAADLRHHIEGLPIDARPATWSYQLSRFAQRNRVLVAGVAATLVALTVGLVSTFFFALRATANEGEARELAYRMGVGAAATALTSGDSITAEARLNSVPRELRGWEWNYLHARLQQSVNRFELSTEFGDLRAFRVHPETGILMMLQQVPKTGRFRLSLWHPDPEEPTEGRLTSRDLLEAALITIGECNRRLYWVDPAGERLEVRDALTDELLLASELPAEPGFSLSQGRLCAGPDPTRILLFNEGRLVLFDATGERPTRELSSDLNGTNGSHASNRLRITQDGRFAFALSPWSDRTYRFSLDDPAESPQILSLHHWAMGLTADGRRLLASERNSAQLVRFGPDGQGGLRREALHHDHRDQPVAIALTPDGTIGASLGEDGQILVWDMETMAVVRMLAFLPAQTTFNPRSPNARLAITPGGEHLYAAAVDDRRVVVQSYQGLRNDPEVMRHDGMLRSSTISADGDLLFSGTFDGQVSIYDLTSRTHLKTLDFVGERILKILSLNDDRIVLKLHHNNQTQTVIALDWRDDSQRTILETQNDAERGERLSRLAHSPDRTKLFYQTGLEAGVLDATTWEPVWVAAELGGFAGQCAWSPNGSLIAVCSQEGPIQLIDAEDPKRIRSLEGHTAASMTLAFHPDGGSLASWGGDRSLRLWDLETGQGRILYDDWPETMALSFLPDGSRLLAGGLDRDLHVLDGRTGQEIVRLTGHTDSIHTITPSADGETLVTGAGDRRLMALSLAPEEEVHRARQEWQTIAERLRPRVQTLEERMDARSVVNEFRVDASLSPRELEIALQLVIMD